MTAWPDPARAVTAWNQHHEVGVQVEYRSRKDAEPVRTVITAQAEVLQGHTAVVKNGKSIEKEMAKLNELLASAS